MTLENIVKWGKRIAVAGVAATVLYTSAGCNTAESRRTGARIIGWGLRTGASNPNLTPQQQAGAYEAGRTIDNANRDEAIANSGTNVNININGGQQAERGIELYIGNYWQDDPNNLDDFMNMPQEIVGRKKVFKRSEKITIFGVLHNRCPCKVEYTLVDMAGRWTPQKIVYDVSEDRIVKSIVYPENKMPVGKYMAIIKNLNEDKTGSCEFEVTD